ncbi:Kininogen-1 [Galemys pyrenaicus]|uniref:Thiol proteinase inhibitor n=1 Tax=Galemys pyrenaicus TaxID=202257 RepID=A0A8J6DSD7_GALPY|nr:Kininogen-1 [Galemys pyrenaicus]
MRLITIIFLCSRLLSSSSQEVFSLEVDCDDEDVFQAVDAALKKYNSRKESGNQFVLYRISNITKTDDMHQYFSFKYQIKEGDCPVRSGKTWQDCDYKQSEDAATGECIVMVEKNVHNKFLVTNQTCHITPGEGPILTDRYKCLGCLYPVLASDSGVERVLNHAIQHFNNHSTHSHLFALKKVKSAYKQVVAGWNFDITYSIMQTNCPKADFPALTAECQILPNGDIAECRDLAYMEISERVATLTQKCDMFPAMDFVPKMCKGCVKEIPVDSSELEEVLTHSIKKLNAENNGTFYFKIDSVGKATKQEVAGLLYSIEFTAKETTCPKESNTEFTSSCEIKEPGTMLRKRPPGFSPFRTAITMDEREETTVSSPHTSMVPVQDEEQYSERNQEPTRGHGKGHKKHIKHGLGHGHKHKHDQGQGHIMGHGFGHGHQKQRGLGRGHQQKHDIGHEHQRELDYDLEQQRRHGFGHGHQRGHGLAHGHKREHGHGHGKHKNKNISNGKHNSWETEHLAISSEDGTAPSAHTQEKRQWPTPTPSLARPGGAVTFPDFQDSDLFAAVMPTPSPAPTESDDDWIPNIQVAPNSVSFSLISDFPETPSPKCPGRPWKPINGMNPAMEVKEFDDFDLSDALLSN